MIVETPFYGYVGGVFSCDGAEGDDGGHAVIMIGWGEEKGIKYAPPPHTHTHLYPLQHFPFLTCRDEPGFPRGLFCCVSDAAYFSTSGSTH